MNEEEIFDQLFKVAKKSKDPEGVVAACLVKNGKIVVISPSASDGIRHAEDLVLEKAEKENIEISPHTLLVTTLEPCSYRNPVNNVDDCTTIIIKSGIKKVLFAANDPEFSKEAEKRFIAAGVEYQQVKNPKIIRRSVELFNSTIKIPLTSMNLPRAKKLPTEL